MLKAPRQLAIGTVGPVELRSYPRLAPVETELLRATVAAAVWESEMGGRLVGRPAEDNEEFEDSAGTTVSKNDSMQQATNVNAAGVRFESQEGTHDGLCDFI